MAFNPVTGIKDMTSAMTSFKKELNSVLDILKKISPIAETTATSFKGIQASGNVGVGTKMQLGTDGANIRTPTAPNNVMAGSLATSQAQTNERDMAYARMVYGSKGLNVARMGVGVAQVAMAPAAAMYAALPDVGTAVSTAGGFYGAAAGTNVNYFGLQKATFGALTGGTKAGVTGATDMAAASAYLTQGYNMYAGGQAYMQTMREVGGAARFLNMNNATAAQALGQYQTGAFGANLYQYGIMQFDASGKPRNQGAIAQDIYKYIFGNQRMSAEQMSQQLQYGTAGPTLREMAVTPENYQILQKQFLLMAQGKSPDLTSQTGTGNPALAAQQISTSQASLVTATEQPMLQGMQTAADMIGKFNKALEGTPESILKLKGAIDTVAGSNIGSGIKAGTAALATGLGNIIGGAGNLYMLNKIRKLLGATSAEGATAAGTAGEVGTAGTAGAIGSSIVSRIAGAGTVLAVGRTARNMITDPSGSKFQAELDKKTSGNSGIFKTIKQTLLSMLHDPLGAAGGSPVGFGASFGPKGGPRGAQSPVPGVSPTTKFGAKDPSMWSGGAKPYHTGQDYPVPEGTPVQAVLSGTVIDDITDNGDLGLYVEIDHGNGYQTVYGHLSSVSVNVGETVGTGQVIGKSGATGNVTGPHLHFEVRKGKNNPVDPKQLLGGGSVLSQKGSTVLSQVSGGVEPTLGTILGTGDQQDWARKFLTKIGKPLSPSNVKAVTTWMAYEGGHWKNTAHYNPLNTTQPEPGATSMNYVGVKSYQSWDQGLQATVDTINNGRYQAILSALSQGDNTQAVLQAVNKSPWGTHIPTAKGGASVGYGASVPQNQTVSGGNNVTINITAQNTSEAELMRIAKVVQDVVENKHQVTMMAGK